jgi:putative MFS transporter
MAGDASSDEGALRLYGWRDKQVLAVAFLAMAAGFGQFGAVAALGDVAKSFGHLTHGATIADQAGLSGTVLGIGLAVFRLASFGGLPLAGLADRFGRRATALWMAALGLLLTMAAAASPSYWWFVVIFALGRPLLSATAGITQVLAAEHTGSKDRAKAMALIAAGYAGGAGLTAVVHGLGEGTLGFRGVFALAAVPLVLLPLLARWLVEPDRFNRITVVEHARPVLGPVGAPYRRRLLQVTVLAFAVSVVSGPATSFLFLYAQNVRHVSGVGVSAMVLAAGVTGFGGLMVGRWLADHIGRRPAVAMALLATIAFAIFTYSGTRFGLFAGYVLGVFAGGAFAPGAGALVNELFPTAVRASVAGWQIAGSVLGAITGLLVFGAVADVGNRFSVAAVVTFVPVALFTVILWFLPETKGLEPEQLGLGGSSP